MHDVRRSPCTGTKPPAGQRQLGTRTWDDADNVLLRYAVTARHA
jgi:hypothetical protein